MLSPFYLLLHCYIPFTGIVLEEDKAGNIFIAEVYPDGNASKSGLVDVGDQLIAVSAGKFSVHGKLNSSASSAPCYWDNLRSWDYSCLLKRRSHSHVNVQKGFHDIATESTNRVCAVCCLHVDIIKQKVETRICLESHCRKRPVSLPSCSNL